MSTQPDTDRGLAETSGRLATNGVRALAVGVTLYVIGAILILADISTVAGLMCVGLATPPTIFAIGMLVSGGVGKRASKQKPFA